MNYFRIRAFSWCNEPLHPSKNWIMEDTLVTKYLDIDICCDDTNVLPYNHAGNVFGV